MALRDVTALAASANVSELATTSQAYLESEEVRKTRSLLSELCRHFYSLGWVTGTGGSITIKVHDDTVPRQQQLIVMSPSGVQKERMVPDDMYVLSPNGSLLWSPSQNSYPHKRYKCSDCAPLFLKAYEKRNAGAVIHSHGIESCLVTMINPLSKEFRITHMEMIKGINGHGYYDELVVPIIENSAHERDLTEALSGAIESYPKTTAVLVRNHGIYVWGDSWINAKTQAECYHYLFDAAFKLHQLGLDFSTPSHGPYQVPKVLLGDTGCKLSTSVNGGILNGSNLPLCIVLDIEGTTTPISFVTDVLFPYARHNIGKHLDRTYDTEETQSDIRLMCSQVEEDVKMGISGAVMVPADGQKVDVISGVVKNVEAMMEKDRKVTALKELQGHIWQTGFFSNELKGIVFEDVPLALNKWDSSGIKVYIYSSGSRLAQRLLFGHSNHGDLRKYLSGFFDTTVGGKKVAGSYREIAEYLGVEYPSQILFVTDVVQEADAAKSAGWEVVISVRPGNAPLPENHGFRTVTSFSEI